MSRSTRAIIGALLGALLTLAIHPYARPRLFTALWSWGNASVSNAPDVMAGVAVLPQPRSVGDYSVWMEAGARRVLERTPTKDREWTSLRDAARRAAQIQPDNAFWPQMEAVFSLAASHRMEARSRWLAASKLARWDDVQTKRLLNYERRLRERYGSAAWEQCTAYAKRSPSPAMAIEAYARDIARTTSFDTESDLRVRYATVANGKLMRDGARSMHVLEMGIAVVELASYPSGLTSINSPRKLLLARAQLYAALRNFGMTMQSDDADKVFRDNDSWLGLPNSTETRDIFEGLSVQALAAACIVPAMLVSVGAGLCGFVVLRILSTDFGLRLFEPAWILVVGVIAALVTFWTTGSAIAAVAVSSAAAFLVFSPPNTRSKPSFDLGPLHAFLVLIVAILGAASLTFAVTQYTVPGREVLDAIGYQSQSLGGVEPIAAVGALSLSMLALVATFYAFVYRIETQQVFLHTLKGASRTLAWAGLTLAVVSAPAALWLDRHVSSTMQERLANEPVYVYLND